MSKQLNSLKNHTRHYHKVLVVSENQSENLGDRFISNNLIYNLQLRNCLVSDLSLSSGGNTWLVSTTRKLLTILLIPFGNKRQHFIWKLLLSHYYRIYFLSCIRKHDLVIFGPGQLLKSNKSYFLEKFSLIAKLCFKYNIQFIGVGIGLDPFDSASLKKNLPSRYLQGFHAIFRGYDSRVNFLSLYPSLNPSNFEHGPDLGFIKECIHKNLPLPSGSNNLDAVAINIMSIKKISKASHDSSATPDSLFSAYCRHIINLATIPNNQVTLFTTGSRLDNQDAALIYNYCNEVADVHLNLNLFIPKTLQSLLSFLSSQDKTLAVRMHSGIMAHISGSSCIAVVWDHKINEVWGEINQQDRLLTVDQFILMSTDDLVDKFNKCKASKASDIERLSSSVSSRIDQFVVRYLT